jgi:cytoskeleton protein RodZ
MNTQDENQISNMSATSEPSLSVGKTLRAAREQLGLSVNDVANRIKFAPRQIEALEADDYVRLPEAAFVRGFVRGYARLLELDPTSLLGSLPSSHAQPLSAKEVKSVEIAMPTASTARRYNIALLAAGLVIALSVAIFERLNDNTPEQVEPVAGITVQPLELPIEATENVPVQLPEQAVAPVSVQKQVVPQQGSRSSAQVSVSEQPVPQPAPRAAQVVAPPVPPQVARPVPAPAPQAVVTTTVPAISNAQPAVGAELNAATHALRLEFDEEAWVEIKDASEQILVSRMHRAGSLVRVTGKAPLLLIIGNARAVRLFDNGKKINLERYTSAEVARVTLK